MCLSKSQINKLGERIRKKGITSEDANMLEQFRVSFDEAFAKAMEALASILKPFFKNQQIKLTKRETKTTQSIQAKLIRLKGRLAEMQDIRGSRIVTENLIMTNKIVRRIKKSDIKHLIDVRKDTIGYRAVHIILYMDEKPIEVQLRTKLEDSWANLCEKYSSEYNDLKYGSKDLKIKNTLKELSNRIGQLEESEKEVYTKPWYTNLKVKKELSRIRKKIEQAFLDIDPI